MEWDVAAQWCEEILADVDEVPHPGAAFAESVRTKVESMLDWIVENEHVTDNMLTALENMHDGVKRWLH